MLSWVGMCLRDDMDVPRNHVIDCQSLIFVKYRFEVVFRVIKFQKCVDNNFMNKER